jgi:hypothetical protein
VEEAMNSSRGSRVARRGSGTLDGAGRLLRDALPAAVALLCLLALATTASAAPTAVPAYSYSNSIASEGQLTGPTSGSLGAIAVEAGSGNVIVSSGQQQRIEVYAPDAGPSDPPLTTFGFPATTSSIAVDQESGAIYLFGGGSFTRWISDGAPLPSYTLDSAFQPVVNEYAGSIAVDPVTGDVLVTEPNMGEVSRYDSTGAKLSSFAGVDLPVAITVGLDGTIYVIESNKRTVSQFTASGERLGKLPVSVEMGRLALDPATGVINVAHLRDGHWEIRGFAGGKEAFVVPFPAFTDGIFNAGIAVDPVRGRLFAYHAPEASPGAILRFDPATSPGVDAPVVSALTTTTAHLSAEVDPGAGPPSGSYIRFEYSPDGGASWASTPDQVVTAAETVEADLTGLEPNQEYLVRAVAGNDRIARTSEATGFTTSPVAPETVTGPASDLGSTSAVLTGTINAWGLQSTFHFEYGTTLAYGGRIPATGEAIAGNGRAPRTYSRTLTGLAPETTYHYRLVAENEIGISLGEDRTFTTSAAGEVQARGYEQVTPVDKLGGTIDPTIGFLIGADGSNISYFTRSPGNAKGAPLLGRFMSRRGAEDWQSGVPVDPPLNVVRVTVFSVTLGVSADFSHAFVVSNRSLAPGAIENGTNLYLVDLNSDTYTLVGSTNALFALASFTGPNSNHKFLFGSPDFSTVVFPSEYPLLPGVSGTAFYRWSSADGLELESKLPDGSAPSTPAVIQGSTGVVRAVSDDGRRDYFALSGGADEGIYLWEEGQTRAISVSERAGDPATPQPGEFLGASRDGRYGFFLTYSAQLTEDAPAEPGTVYRYDAETDDLEYIGTQARILFGYSPIAVSDDGGTLYFSGLNGVEVWRDGAVRIVTEDQSVGLGRAYTTPDGRYLAYSAAPTIEEQPIYLYDAKTEESTCVSCLADGTDPGGAGLPDSESFVNNRLPTVLDDEGNVYFDTSARLVAADTNGTKDVYEFHAGRPRLISPGNQPFEARFADVTPDGESVFFTTAQKLVGRDDDKAVDIYVARVGGGLPAQSPPPPQTCSGFECGTASPNPPPPAVIGTESAPKVGKVNRPKGKGRCPRGSRRVRHKGKQRCVKKHPKKANQNRRQAR